MQGNLWSKKAEYNFFKWALRITTPEKLFYFSEDGRYLAYWPKAYKGKRTTLQSRNTFVGDYTEKWVKDLLKPFADELNAYVVQGVVCEEIGISSKSPIDIAIVKIPDRIQRAENILLIVEVKMSIVWNWEYDPETEDVRSIGDFTTHMGNPSLLRSDTVLKAIGKSVNIRVSGFKSSRIPIIVMGNTPITRFYHKKVDFLKQSGIVQGFYSLNPNPLDGEDTGGINIKRTPGGGFLRIDSVVELYEVLHSLLSQEREFFSSMLRKADLGRLIELADKEPTYERKAEKFLKLLREVNYG